LLYAVRIARSNSAKLIFPDGIVKHFKKIYITQ